MVVSSFWTRRYCRVLEKLDFANSPYGLSPVAARLSWEARRHWTDPSTSFLRAKRPRGAGANRTAEEKGFGKDFDGGAVLPVIMPTAGNRRLVRNRDKRFRTLIRNSALSSMCRYRRRTKSSTRRRGRCDSSLASLFELANRNHNTLATCSSVDESCGVHCRRRIADLRTPELLNIARPRRSWPCVNPTRYSFY